MNYLVECVNHGNITIWLRMWDGPGANAKQVAIDSVNAVMVVDRVRTGSDAPDNIPRFRVRAKVALANVDGIEAKMTSPGQPKMDWGTSVMVQPELENRAVRVSD